MLSLSARKRLLVALVLSVAFVSPFLPPVYAEENFATSYTVDYQLKENGVTHAVLKGTLSNKTTELYASSYKIEVGFPSIQNVLAFDPSGAIIPMITKTANGYLIGLDFNTKIVGKGNELHFTISFDTPDIVRKSGSIWEVNIPGITDQEAFRSFVVHVTPPKSFGPPMYVKPAVGDTETLTFSKEQLGKSGISIAFGKSQIYAFTLHYHIRNAKVYKDTQEIALPPSTNYQNVAIEQIKPRPTNVIRDGDGNWLAQYSLKPSERLDITVIGKAEVSLVPRKQPTHAAELLQYTVEKPHWEVGSEKIKKLAKKLKTPENIYTYVVKTLKYDYSRAEGSATRIGAKGVLENPQSAVCLEFSDLFIAIARAAGIPTREVNGFAYTQDAKERPLSLVKDVLHAWPEYYDTTRETWIMIDPTWGNTTNGVDYFHTLDFDHVAFVIKGRESEYPIAAGGYKNLEEITKKDITVAFAPSISKDTQNLDFTSQIADAYDSAVPIHGMIRVKNIGYTLSAPQKLFVTSPVLTPPAQALSVPEIPPFGYLDIPTSFERTPFLTNATYPFTIRLVDRVTEKKIKIAPVLFDRWTLRGGIIIAILSSIILVLTFQTGRISFFRRKK